MTTPITEGGGGSTGGGDGGSSGGATEFKLPPGLLDLLGGGDGDGKGGSGGGSAAAPVDPNVVGGTRDYYAIWGIQPPHGYIEGLVKQGLNRYEIVEHELAKPRAESTGFYRDRYAAFAARAASIFGRR